MRIRNTGLRLNITHLNRNICFQRRTGRHFGVRCDVPGVLPEDRGLAERAGDLRHQPRHQEDPRREQVRQGKNRGV